MGKSTLVHNLQPFLPISIRVASVSMQDPCASTSLISWIQWIAKAITTAAVSGDAVLRQLVRDDCRLDGEWDYLKGFRTRDAQAPPEDEALYQSLRRRLMVADEAGACACP